MSRRISQAVLMSRLISHAVLKVLPKEGLAVAGR